MWRRSSDEYARERAGEAKAMAERAYDAIKQHMVECTTKTEALTFSINRQFQDMRDNQMARHSENVGRLDRQDRTLGWLLGVGVTIAGSLIVGMATLIYALLHGAGKL